MKPISSAISSSLRQVETAQSTIGLRPGETGYGELETTNARNWLVGRSPAATDLALKTSLQSQHGVNVSERTETRFPTEGSFYSVLVGCDLHGELIDREGAVRRLELALTPLSRDDAETIIAMLHVATASRKQSGDGAEMALDLYASNLCKFPADVARAACEKVAKGNGGVAWFPTLAELDHACEQLAAPRRHMLRAVQSWAPRTLIEQDLTARDWLYSASQAQDELDRFPKPDAERQSELKEFITVCNSNAKAIRQGRAA